MAFTNEQFGYKFHQLQKQIKQHYIKWTRNGYPALSEMADSVKSWKSDADLLTINQESLTPSFQEAVLALEEAYENRDDREAVLSFIKRAMVLFNSVKEELEVPELTTATQTKTVKGLYGDFVARYHNEPNNMIDIYSISRKIKALQVSGIKTRKNLSFVIEDIEQLAGAYTPGHPVVKMLTAAAKSLQDSLAYEGQSKPKIAQSLVDKADKYVVEAAAMINNAANTQNQRPELDSISAKSVQAELNNLLNVVTGYHFNTPNEFLPKVVKVANRVKSVIDQHYDPKSSRLIKNIISNLQLAASVSNDTSVKSIRQNGWRVEAIEAPFNIALSNIDALKTHLHLQ